MTVLVNFSLASRPLVGGIGTTWREDHLGEPASIRKLRGATETNRPHALHRGNIIIRIGSSSIVAFGVLRYSGLESKLQCKRIEEKLPNSITASRIQRSIILSCLLHDGVLCIST
jgi:hypothetical protein